LLTKWFLFGLINHKREQGLFPLRSKEDSTRCSFHPLYVTLLSKNKPKGDPV
jgi:hypothetical protein